MEEKQQEDEDQEEIAASTSGDERAMHGRPAPVVFRLCRGPNIACARAAHMAPRPRRDRALGRRMRRAAAKRVARRAGGRHQGGRGAAVG